MRHRIHVIGLSAIVIVVVLISSCSLSAPEVTIGERIDKFENDLDANDWGSLYTHIHPDNGKRNQTKDKEYWTSIFDSGSYSFSTTNRSSDSRTVTVSADDGSWNGDDLKFEMKETEGGIFERAGWYIDGITSETGPTSTVL